ncbi:Helix-turn-helix domain-containing protein [Paenibacillus sp. UNC496MF]|uniref:response regulator n=1 Tax=Paenibacillus sp. UNC496MF TaxID=1502753 RepID=UPI0008F2137B|nr:response regulator [Paenibacillus sp. UNC496MF]SFI76587.1 Helix-turn-helix domain-containing protein [Paenibacillus sp. UNC496MF]
MYRLLIVDDERFTVDGLYEMIEEIEELELDLYRAYSPEEALDWLARAKIDIVLSDVRMPGMTGLELQKRIVAQWPRCKIIFLTGIHQLETAQTAMRTGSIDYILKTEGDEAIERSIRKAVAALDAETASESFLLQAKRRVSEAMPLLHRDWLQAVLERQAPAATDGKLAELNVPLRRGLQVLPLIGRIDWPEAAGYRDRSLLLYAVQNIAAEYYEPLAFFSVSLDRSHFMCLLQPRAAADGADMADTGAPEAAGASESAGTAEKAGASESAAAARDAEVATDVGAADDAAYEADPAWPQTVGFARGTMESVQRTCERLLQLDVSLIGCVRPVAWTALPDAYDAMRRQLQIGLGSRDRMLLLWRPDEGDARPREPELQPPPPPRVIGSQLERLLEEGNEAALTEAVREHVLQPARYADYARAYYAIAGLLLGHLAPEGAERAEDDGGAIDALMNLSAHRSREDALQQLLGVASDILARRRSVQTECTRQVIAKLHAFIRANLAGDLSLTRLSEVVYLNPAYLSVLYKQQTGLNLSEYIAEARLEKAKELLATTPLKIQDIADRVGFETAGYFNRFFKKRLRVTPQEYRARA